MPKIRCGDNDDEDNDGETKVAKNLTLRWPLGGPTCPATHQLPTQEKKNCTVANTAPSYTAVLLYYIALLYLSVVFCPDEQ